MDILDSQTPQQLRDENNRLRSAMRRAHHCLVDGRRVGDAIRILKVAMPNVAENPESIGGGAPPKKSA